MSDSASVYEPDDDAESESDFEQTQTRPSKERSRSSVREPNVQTGHAKECSRSAIREPNDQNNHGGRVNPLINGVGLELSYALMERNPPMRGSLTFLRGYKHLFAESQEAVEYASLGGRQNIYQLSQHGSVIWTPTEKQLFFNTIERKGKSSIKELAATIGTKSELEIIEFIRFLDNALESQYISEKHVERMPGLSDIPAAMEVSQECCELLDDYGDVLVFQESSKEAKVGIKKYGDNWIITDDLARNLVVDDGTARGDLRLAAGLFTIPDWIRLSRSLFMNFGGSKAENNWLKLAQGHKNVAALKHTPSMTAGSLVDFYSLAVSVTRRLVQSSIFFSMSRVRSASRSGRDRKGHVRMQDVRAAIEVLNMKHRRPNLVDTARRNELVIQDIHNRKGWVSSVFSYEEAEEIIDKNEWFRYRKDGTIFKKGQHEEGSEDDEDELAEENNQEAQPGPESASESESEPESELLSELDDNDADHLPSRESSEMSSPLESSDELEMDPEEELAEAADQTASRHHEANLLRLMEQPLPSTLDESMKSEDTEADPKPQSDRRARDATSRWRDRTIYRSEWEEYGYDFADVKEEMEMPPRKRPRFNEPTPVLSVPAPPGERSLIDNKPTPLETQHVRKKSKGDKGPSEGQSWLNYYMTQFGKPGTQGPE